MAVFSTSCGVISFAPSFSPQPAHVSGLWQYLQRILQPFKNTIYLTPGPSAEPKLSTECTLPSVSPMFYLLQVVAATFIFIVRNFRQPADRDFSMLRFFGLRGCMNYDLGFLCLTRPAFTHLPKIPYAVVLFSTYAVYLEIRICRHLACTFWNVGYFFILHSLVACT